jgi:hypothetical protein
MVRKRNDPMTSELKLQGYRSFVNPLSFYKQGENVLCILSKAISYGNCHKKIINKIRVKRSKLFLIGGKNSPSQFFNGKSCYYLAISISTHGINSPPQIFNGRSCSYPGISISTHGINSPP